MSTRQPLTDQELDYLSTVPMRTPFVHAKPHTPYQRHLAKLGATTKAQRDADTAGNFKWYKVDDADAWRSQIYTSMLRTDPYKAARLAEDQYAAYHMFGSLIDGDSFTRFDAAMPLPAAALGTPEHAAAQEDVHKLRRAIAFHLPRSLDKLGASDAGRLPAVVMAGLYAGVVTTEQRRAIEASLPPGATIRFLTLPKAAFREQLRMVLSPTLPKNDLRRAEFEVLLDGIRQIKLHGTSLREIRQFALETLPPYANYPSNEPPLTPTGGRRRHPTRLEPIPVSPKTGRPARFVSVTVDQFTRAEDLHPLEWIPLARVQ